jgi:nitrate/nitrite transporter NarK
MCARCQVSEDRHPIPGIWHTSRGTELQTIDETKSSDVGAERPLPETMPWGQLLLAITIPMTSMVGILNFAPLLPLIRDAFALTNVWSGAVASATILSHTMLQIPGGYVADRIGVKRSIEVGVGLVALGVLASSAAPSIGLLLLCRFVVGVGTAISFISGLSFVNSVTPPSKRLMAQGLFGATSNVGVLLVMLLSGRLVAWGGWRGTFLTEGLFLLAITFIIAAGLRSDIVFSHSASASWGETIRQPHLYLLGLGHVLGYGAFTGMSAWAVTFLWEKYQIGLEWAGLLSAFLPASSIVARILGGTISRGRERRSVVVCCAVTAIGIGLLPLLPNPVLAVCDLAVVGWFAAMPFGAIFTYSSLILGDRASGRDLSLINFVGNLGALLFPPAVGYALDITGSFVLGFGVVAAAGLIGSTVVAIWLPRPKTHSSFHL